MMFSIRGCGWRYVGGFRKGRLGSRVAFVQHALVCTLPSLILTSVYNLLLVANRYAIGCFRGCYLKKSHLNNLNKNSYPTLQVFKFNFKH